VLARRPEPPCSLVGIAALLRKSPSEASARGGGDSEDGDGGGDSDSSDDGGGGSARRGRQAAVARGAGGSRADGKGRAHGKAGVAVKDKQNDKEVGQDKDNAQEPGPAREKGAAREKAKGKGPRPHRPAMLVQRLAVWAEPALRTLEVQRQSRGRLGPVDLAICLPHPSCYLASFTASPPYMPRCPRAHANPAPSLFPPPSPSPPRPRPLPLFDASCPSLAVPHRPAHCDVT
jgi:hypothetical protein